MVILARGFCLPRPRASRLFRGCRIKASRTKIPAGCPGWLLPIGIESGFSSAGAGALGTVLLLNYSEMTPPQVVGTDLLFGLVLAVIGSAFHWKFGSINGTCSLSLLAGGIPGVLIGCIFARRVPARKLKVVIAVIAIFAGLAARLERLAHDRRKAHAFDCAGCRGSSTEDQLIVGRIASSRIASFRQAS